MRLIVGMFRDAGRRWATEADRLDRWAADEEAALGGREIMVTAGARFRASILRLGAALLGQA